jgi:hypothetical protein
MYKNHYHETVVVQRYLDAFANARHTTQRGKDSQ